MDQRRRSALRVPDDIAERSIARHGDESPGRPGAAAIIGAPAAEPRKLAHTIIEAARISGIPRSSLYELARDGKLRVVKRGRRSLILDEDLRTFLRNLPAADLERRDGSAP